MAVFLSFILGVGTHHLSQFFPLSSLVLALASAACAVVLWNVRTADRQPVGWASRSLVVMTILGAGYIYALAISGPHEPLGAFRGERIAVRGVPASEAMVINKDKGVYSQLLEVEEAVDSGQTRIDLSSIRIIGGTQMSPGSRYSVLIAVPNSPLMNPGHRYQAASGYALAVTEIGDAGMGIFRDARVRVNRLFREGFSEESGAFLMSQVTGDRSRIPRDVRQAFNATGLAHILSISGTHFGLLFVVLFKVIKSVVRLIPISILVKVTNYLTPSQIAAVFCLPLMACYLGISSMSTPAVRSFLMIALFLMGLLINRRGMWLNTLLFAATVILLLDPGALLDLSFQLSFVAVLCIGLVSEQRRDIREGEDQREGDDSIVRQVKKRAVHFAGLTVLISLAATIGTAPLVAYYFHYFPVISPVTNLVITPVIGFVILPLSLISSFIFLLTGFFPFQPLIEALVKGVLAAIADISRLPMIDLPVPSFPPVLLVTFYVALLCAVMIFACSSPGAKQVRVGEDRDGLPISPASSGKERGSVFTLRHGLLAACLLCATLPFVVYATIRAPLSSRIQATFLDAGQADAAVVELPDSKVLVIDTGKSGVQVGDFLRYRGIRKIDALIISHADTDHSGGARYLLENFRVAELWDNGRLVYSFPVGDSVMRRNLARGDVLYGEGYRIVCLHPYEGYYGDARREYFFNDESLVLKIEGRNSTFLFTGDIERDAQDNLLEIGKHLRSTVLKVPHHGGRTALTPDFAGHVSPEMAVISVGRGNRYGMPHREVLDMLSDAVVYRTDRDGAVGISEEQGRPPKVVTAREFSFETGSSPGSEWRNAKRLFRTW